MNSKTRPLTRWASGFASVGVVLLGVAAKASSVVVTHEENVGRTFVNLRTGLSTSSRLPVICLEVAPLSRLSLQACGTGAGFLTDSEEAEIARFELLTPVAVKRLDGVSLSASLAAGVSEIQIGKDAPGLYFTSAGPHDNETAGPHLGIAARAVLPLPSGFEFIADLGLSVAYFQFAPHLLTKPRQLAPAGTITAGVGF